MVVVDSCEPQYFETHQMHKFPTIVLAPNLQYSSTSTVLIDSVLKFIEP